MSKNDEGPSTARGTRWSSSWRRFGRDEHDKLGHAGRFGPGLPRVSDGSLLFLLHLLSKMRPAVDGGSRFGIVLNGSPLFTGGAGSGGGKIRRYVLENDLVEAMVELKTSATRLIQLASVDSRSSSPRHRRWAPALMHH